MASCPSFLPVPRPEKASPVLSGQAPTTEWALPWLEPKLDVTGDQVGAATYHGASSTSMLMTVSLPTETTNVDSLIPLGAAWYPVPLFWEKRQEDRRFRVYAQHVTAPGTREVFLVPDVEIC